MAAALKQFEELFDREEPGWPLVQEWIAEAKNPVEVLAPPNDALRETALVHTQVTTRSPMGAVIYETGGIFVDYGWIRILGSGHPRLPRSAPDWNWKRSFHVSGERPSFFLCGDDAVGGFFAIDGGGLGVEAGKVCYFAPDSLRWENTKLGYSQFLTWCFQGDLATYYQTARWPNWQEDVTRLGGDQVFGIYPFLFCEGPPVAERSRKPLPITEIYDLHVGEQAKKK
jgi:hypothetical protein